jgi:hypothetical protein
MEGASAATQPWSDATPAGIAVCGLAVEGVPGAVVVVVVEGVVVVVVVEGTVVVGTVVDGTVVVVVVGSVVVVVAVGGSVVVVVVVVVVVGSVVDGTVVDGTVVVGPVVAGVPAAGTLFVGAVMDTVVQAPAICMVAMSATIWVRDWRSAASADASATVASVTALVAASRPAIEAFTATSADCARDIRLLAAMLRYCWATTPSASCGADALTPLPRFAIESVAYSPLFTYSSIAKRRRARDAASYCACADERWISAAASPCWRVVSALWSDVAAATSIWYERKSDFTFPNTSRAAERVSNAGMAPAAPRMVLA